MVPWLSLQALTPSLPDHCVPSNAFLLHLSSSLHTCIPSNLALVSTGLGTLSIASWLFAQLPQIYKNYILKSTSGLSVYFLVEWCLGDLFNLLGAVYTRQATWQMVVASYYCLVDAMLVFQWFWYDHHQKRSLGTTLSGEGGNLKASSGMQGVNGRSIPVGRASWSQRPLSKTKAQPPEHEAAPSTRTAPQNIFRIPSFSSSSPHTEEFSLHTPTSRTLHRGQASSSPMLSPKTVLFLTLSIALCARASPAATAASIQPHQQGPRTPPEETMGRVFSWLSTLLYLLSRLPQLLKNFSRRSTAGLSPALFIAAFFGNLFYSSSILTNPCAWYDLDPHGGGGWVGAVGNNSQEWLGRATPFFLGAAGVLLLDAAVFCQFLAYGDAKEEQEAVVVQDLKRGRSRWRRVSGWMRGWVPSADRSTARLEDEGERLLNPEGGESFGYGGV